MRSREGALTEALIEQHLDMLVSLPAQKVSAPGHRAMALRLESASGANGLERSRLIDSFHAQGSAQAALNRGSPNTGNSPGGNEGCA